MAKKRLVITDLTHMWDDEVCIAGIDRNRNCVRPITPEGVRRSHLFQNDQLIVYPGALVEFDLKPVSILMPPHIEDWYFDPNGTKRIVDCTEAQWEDILNSGCFASVYEMFDGYLEEGRRVPHEADTRSLGTLCSPKITSVSIGKNYSGKQQFRIDFTDQSGASYKGYPVNDLAFRRLMCSKIDALSDHEKAAASVFELMQTASRVYLRIGLARPRELGSYPMACWTQITGVYTFPDYLHGKTFADFE